MLGDDVAVHLITLSIFSCGICRVSERVFAEITREAVQGTDIVAASRFDIRVGLGFTVAFIYGSAERGNGNVGVVHESAARGSVV